MWPRGTSPFPVPGHHAGRTHGVAPRTGRARAVDGGHGLLRDLARRERSPEWRRAAQAQASDLAGLPAALGVTAGFDPLQDEGRDYAQALRRAGVATDHLHYPALVHDFYVMGDVSPAVLAAAEEAGEAIRAAL